MNRERPWATTNLGWLFAIAAAIGAVLILFDVIKVDAHAVGGECLLLALAYLA